MRKDKQRAAVLGKASTRSRVKGRTNKVVLSLMVRETHELLV